MNTPKSLVSFTVPFTISPSLYVSWNLFAGESAISLIDNEMFSFSLSILMIFTSTSSPFLNSVLHFAFGSQEASSLCNKPSTSPIDTNAPKSVKVAILPLITSPTLCSLVNLVKGFSCKFFKDTLNLFCSTFNSITSTLISSPIVKSSFGFFKFLFHEISEICNKPSMSFPKSTNAP